MMNPSGLLRSAGLRLVASTLLALAFANAALAWGNDGHKIVGTIAASYLTEATAKEVRELLGEEVVADACCWADEIRSNKAYDWVKPLHYVNVPRGAEKVDLSRDGLDGMQVVSSIGKYRDILKDRTKTKEERLLALHLVLHFVGDIHQPLHCSYADDLGGNKISLQSFGRKSNLHRVFDTDLIQRRLKDVSGGWAVLSADLRTSIKDEDRAKWSKSLDPLVWANESFDVTKRIYANPPPAPGDVNEIYYQIWIPTIEERLKMGGIRLAAILNDALDPGGAPNPATSGTPATREEAPSKDAAPKKPGSKSPASKPPSRKPPSTTPPTKPPAS